MVFRVCCQHGETRPTSGPGPSRASLCPYRLIRIGHLGPGCRGQANTCSSCLWLPRELGQKRSWRPLSMVSTLALLYQFGPSWTQLCLSTVPRHILDPARRGAQWSHSCEAHIRTSSPCYQARASLLPRRVSSYFWKALGFLIGISSCSIQPPDCSLLFIQSLLQPPWPPLLFLQHAGVFLPQGLCTCFPLCLECSSPRCLLKFPPHQPFISPSPVLFFL